MLEKDINPSAAITMATKDEREYRSYVEMCEHIETYITIYEMEDMIPGNCSMRVIMKRSNGDFCIPYFKENAIVYINEETGEQWCPLYEQQYNGSYERVGKYSRSKRMDELDSRQWKILFAPENRKWKTHIEYRDSLIEDEKEKQKLEVTIAPDFSDYQKFEGGFDF